MLILLWIYCARKQLTSVQLGPMYKQHMVLTRRHHSPELVILYSEIRGTHKLSMPVTWGKQGTRCDTHGRGSPAARQVWVCRACLQLGCYWSTCVCATSSLLIHTDEFTGPETVTFILKAIAPEAKRKDKERGWEGINVRIGLASPGVWNCGNESRLEKNLIPSDD